MNPGEGYRLMADGELLVEGDEYFSFDADTGWRPTHYAGRRIGDSGTNGYTYRRKLPAPSGWVSVKERLPQPSKFVPVLIEGWGRISNAAYNGKFSGVDHWTLCDSVNDQLAKVTHWFDLPPPPAPPKSDAEIAWERWSQGVRSPDRCSFEAGYNAAKEAK